MEQAHVSNIKKPSSPASSLSHWLGEMCLHIYLLFIADPADVVAMHHHREDEQFHQPQQLPELVFAPSSSRTKPRIGLIRELALLIGSSAGHM
jgi:hypothetical protein